MAGGDDGDHVHGDGRPTTTFFRYETGSGDDDDIFHFFTSTGAGGGGNGEGQGEGTQAPLGAMLQNLLTSMLGPNVDIQRGRSTSPSTEEQPQSGDQQSPQQQGQQQRRPPILLYGGVVDGNVRFRPMNMPGQEGENEGDEASFTWHARQPDESNQEGRQSEQGGTEEGAAGGGGAGARPPNTFAR